MNKIVYDIVYSITAHENFNILNSLISNILKFNKNYYILICLNLNTYMYENRNFIKLTNVIINPKYFDKNKYSSDILKAHIDNFQYLMNQNILFNNIMLIASNCMFIKQVKLPEKNTYENKFCFTDIKNNNIENLTDWHWPNILENKIIINILLQNKIKIMNGQHEGRIYNFTLFYYIYKFIILNNIFNLIEKEAVFEEFLLQSLEYYYNNGKLVPTYCKIFWNNKDYIPSINDIKKCLTDSNIYAVKRVPLNYNNPIRQFINIL